MLGLKLIHVSKRVPCWCCCQVPAQEAMTVVFWIIPVAIGSVPLTVKAQSAEAADGLRRNILVEVSYNLFQYQIIFSGFNFTIIKKR